MIGNCVTLIHSAGAYDRREETLAPNPSAPPSEGLALTSSRNCRQRTCNRSLATKDLMGRFIAVDGKKTGCRKLGTHRDIAHAVTVCMG